MGSHTLKTMSTHKRQRLTELQRKNLWKDWQSQQYTKASLARKYLVSWQTADKYIKLARKKQFAPRKSTNNRYQNLKYGIKRLAKIEKQIEERLKKQAKRYEKSYPGEMVHFDTKRLPLLEGETKNQPREYLFVAIDDYSRELFASIKPDKTAQSAAEFMHQVQEEMGYTMECAYSDNGTEYKGRIDHPFVQACAEYGVQQKFTRPRTPRTNGKAERVIRTLMDMWHSKEVFQSRSHRKTSLTRFLNYYNHVKPHSALKHNGSSLTPYERLISYFFSHFSTQPSDF